MRGKFFLDTNVLIYAFDRDHPKKEKIAVDLIDKALFKNSGVISYQVVHEFINVSMTKFKKPQPAAMAIIVLEQLLDPLCEIYPRMELFKSAVNIKSETGFHYYDSLIIASASEAGCSTLYSEDLQDGYRYHDLTVRNPF